MSKKEVKVRLKMQLAAGAATPAPPVGSSLGPHGVSAMEFCKQFNAATANRRGETVPVKVTVYKDKTFDFITKTSPVSELIRKKINLAKGSQKPGKTTVGSISWQVIAEIAAIKMPDLNADTLEAACNIIAGSARSMGLEVIK